MLQIKDIRTEYMREPLGVDTPAPRFFWRIESDEQGAYEEAYRICVEKEGRTVWDSGKVVSGAAEPAVYAGEPLEPRTHYDVTVAVWDGCGQCARGETFFETGLMRDCRGTWITYRCAPHGVPVFFRQFNAVKKIGRARLYMSVLGVYEARINGERVGDIILPPGWTSYWDRLEYQTYDVTHLIGRSNRLEITVAPGWFSGKVGYYGREHHYGDKNAVWANLYLWFEDGTQQCLFTDGSWCVTSGEVVSAQLYDGEVIDRSRKAEKSVPAVKIEYPFETLVSQECEPVRVKSKLRPVRALISPSGKYLLDFGKNLTGFVEAHLKGERGSRVVLRHGETLDENGELYTKNLREAKAQDTFICSGGEDVFFPSLTYHGFRFVELSGDERLFDKDLFTACEIRSDYAVTGEFSCSDARLNRLFANICNSQDGNFVDIPTDCTQRDERLGWTGDAQIFCPVAAFRGDVLLFFRKWLKDMAAETTAERGVPHTVPDIIAKYPEDGNVAIVNKQGAAAWGDAAAVIPWELYRVYGDRHILAEQYPLMKKWVEFVRSRAGEKHLWQSGFQYGDWLALDGGRDMPSSCIGGTDVYLVASAFYAHSVFLLKEAASALGYPEAEEYAALHRKIVAAFGKEYVTENGRLVSDTQTAAVLVLAFHLADAHRDKIAARLAENIMRHGIHLTTGFVGTPYLLHVLSEIGYHELAGKLMLQEESPSWLYQVKMGATTVWERWDAMLPDGSIPDTGMTSFNHYAYGAVASWLVEKVGGLSPVEPGYRKVRIAPMPFDGVTNAETRFMSRYGKIVCRWEVRSGKMFIEGELPPNVSGEIVFPGEEESIAVSAGRFSAERKIAC